MGMKLGVYGMLHTTQRTVKCSADCHSCKRMQLMDDVSPPTASQDYTGHAQHAAQWQNIP